MCGFAGIARREARGVSEAVLRRMAHALRHRGPDGAGTWSSPRVGLAHTRLSIIDVEGGAQPLTNEDGTVVVSFNGEIYNYIELRQKLVAKGHRFRTRTDTEVLVHGYEEWGEGLLEQLIGQFAFALYDQREEMVLLVRDRFGVRPVFYAEANGDLYFGSEVKAIFATGEVEAAPDPIGLDEVFTMWGARAPRTVFRGVSSLPPGSVAVWRRGRLTTRRYYEPRYPEMAEEPGGVLQTLDELMHDSVTLRMRADVPVGGYLSGGLDSTITCALAAKQITHPLRTFSISFADPRLDESEYQQSVAAHVGSEHSVVRVSETDIADVFPDVVRHAETPMVRTAPAPMYLLARLVRQNGVKVVLTGEGADELFMGYDLFKETAIRLFCLRQPRSTVRPRLFDRLYPYLLQDRRSGGEFWRKFFLTAGGTDGTADSLFSHMPRFSLTARIKDFYSPDMRVALLGQDPLAVLRASLPGEFSRWSPLNRAAYLEMETLLSSYLLSTQGDRMAMAHGVEGRFPFLDHRLFEFAAALPTGSKLRGLKEKEILKRWAKPLIPKNIVARHKQPYRAPDAASFFAKEPEYVKSLLDPSAIKKTGLFDARAADGLVRRCRAGLATGFAENQALVAMLSSQLWHQQFFESVNHLAVPSSPSYTIRSHQTQSRVAVGEAI